MKTPRPPHLPEMSEAVRAVLSRRLWQPSADLVGRKPSQDFERSLGVMAHAELAFDHREDTPVVIDDKGLALRRNRAELGAHTEDRRDLTFWIRKQREVESVSLGRSRSIGCVT
jgi:hypothetical protein